MPWTLYRYILRDVLKLLVLSTAVLLCVISFAGAIKPLADGLLGPTDLVKFMFYASPTMLGFVLPFSAAFASTLVFVRLAQDNELTAVSASGVSYRMILMPIFILGFVLAGGLYTLSNVVVPRFYRAASELVERDAIGVLLAELNRNQAFRRGDWVIYADRAQEVELTPERLTRFEGEATPTRILHLQGVAVSELDSQRRPKSDATAQSATVVMFEDPELEYRWVSVRLRNPVYYDPMRGQFSNELLDQPELELPDRFSDNPKFLSWEDLARLEAQPTLYDRIREHIRRLANQVAAERLRARMSQKLSDPDAYGELVLETPIQQDQYTIRTTGNVELQQGGRLRLQGGRGEPVLVTRQRMGETLRWFEADAVSLTLRGDTQQPEPAVDVTLYNVMVLDAQDAPPTEHPELRLPPLRWQGESMLEDIEKEGGITNHQALLDVARTGALAEVPSVQRAAEVLTRELDMLFQQIVVLRHDRAASAVSCLLVLLLGALLSMQLRGQMVLVIYLWSFLLTLMTVIIINTAWNMARLPEHGLAMKLSLLWSGNAILLVVIGLLYQRVNRH